MNKKLHNRLERIKGQLNSLQTTIDNGAACSDVVPQFLAVRGALTSAFNMYMETSIQDCSNRDKKEIQELVSLLIKK